jgi:hypothetical protein
VLDRDGMRANTDIVNSGAEMMVKDNRRRLMSMLEAAEPYLDALDGRQKRLILQAEVYVNTARSALSALELVDLNGKV